MPEPLEYATPIARKRSRSDLAMGIAGIALYAVPTTAFALGIFLSVDHNEPCPFVACVLFGSLTTWRLCVSIRQVWGNRVNPNA